MMEETDRSSVTLDRRESRDRRAYTERRDNERRDDERRSDERRAIVQNRRTNLRRSDGDEEIIITEEQLKAFESPPLSPKQVLSQILLAIGVLFLLSQL